jgi:hypothetical protein
VVESFFEAELHEKVQQEPPGGDTTNVKVLALIRAFNAEIEKCAQTCPSTWLEMSLLAAT